MSCVVEIARSWRGTPYVHQAAAKGAGTDCLGLIRGIWSEFYGVELPEAPAYTRDWSEPLGQETLWAAAREHLVKKRLDEEAPGDVILFRMRDRAVAKHLGVTGRIGAEASFIHAYTGHGVVESPLSLPWRKRIVARFEFPKG
ncbi:MAG: NlpC/P60 family protein [Pseudomonadota bacterium]